MNQSKNYHGERCKDCGKRKNVTATAEERKNGYLCPRCNRAKLRKYITAAKYIGLTVLGIYLCGIGIKQAYLERGYFAYGGEYLFLFLPLIYYLAKDVIAGTIEMFSGFRKDGKLNADDKRNG